MGALKKWDWVMLGWVGECIKCWPVHSKSIVGLWDLNQSFGSPGP